MVTPNFAKGLTITVGGLVSLFLGFKLQDHLVKKKEVDMLCLRNFHRIYIYFNVLICNRRIEFTHKLRKSSNLDYENES